MEIDPKEFGMLVQAVNDMKADFGSRLTSLEDSMKAFIALKNTGWGAVLTIIAFLIILGAGINQGLRYIIDHLRW